MLRHQLLRNPVLNIHRRLLTCFSCVLIFSAVLAAAITPEQQKKVIATAATLNKMDGLIKARKYDEAVKLLPEIQAAATELGAIPDLVKQTETLVKRIENARTDLELQGLALPEFVKPAKPMPAVPGAKGAPAAGTPATGGVSFVKQVAPFLIAKCGNCHVTQSRGQLNFATYELIEKGFQGKLLLQKGDSKNSEGVREIENGNMPRGGLKVTPDELAMFKKWIDDGAKYDGTDAKVPLPQLVSAAGVKPPANAPAMIPAEPKLEAMAATGKETVSFARDIAPILVDQCYDCHGGGRRDSGGFGMDNFKDLIKGGDSGNPFVPGKPTESLLVKKIKGTAGARMPMGRKPLEEKQIALFDKWVAEGAKFDGGDLSLMLNTMVNMLKAKNATHAQLQKDRDETAKLNWKTSIPDDPPAMVEGKNFLVVGNVGETTLKKISDLAEAHATSLAPQLKLPSDKPLIKGRATLFAMKRRFEYAEWKSVEEREIPTALRGHIRHTMIDAYGVLWIPTDDTEFSLKTLVHEQVAGLLIGEIGQGKIPSWFSGGVGRALAAKGDSRDPRIKQLDSAIAGAVNATQYPVELAKGNIGGENGELLAYGLGKNLIANSSKFTAFIAAMQAGSDFESALVRSYGGNSQQLIGAWTGKGMSPKQ